MTKSPFGSNYGNKLLRLLGSIQTSHLLTSSDRTHLQQAVFRLLQEHNGQTVYVYDRSDPPALPFGLCCHEKLDDLCIVAEFLPQLLLTVIATCSELGDEFRQQRAKIIREFEV